MLSHMAHVLWATLRARVWIEWIDTDANLADGLSRLGLQDPWTLRQRWSLAEADLPPEVFRPAPLRSLWQRFEKSAPW